MLKWLLLPDCGSAACQRLAPDVEGFHALALLRFIKPPLTDKEIVAKKRSLNVFEIVSGLADGAGAMPAKWSRRVFWLRSYEGKIRCESLRACRRCQLVAPYHITWIKVTVTVIRRFCIGLLHTGGPWWEPGFFKSRVDALKTGSHFPSELHIL